MTIFLQQVVSSFDNLFASRRNKPDQSDVFDIMTWIAVFFISNDNLNGGHSNVAVGTN